MVAFQLNKNTKGLSGLNCVDRKGISIFNRILSKKHGLMCPTSTLDKAKKLENRFFSVCVRMRE